MSDKAIGLKLDNEALSRKIGELEEQLSAGKKVCDELAKEAQKEDPKIREFAKELCTLLKKYELSKFDGSMRSGFDYNPSFEGYRFNWDGGRHGATMNRIQLHFAERRTIDINQENPK